MSDGRLFRAAGPENCLFMTLSPCPWYQYNHGPQSVKVKKVKKGIAVGRQACHHRYGNSHAIMGSHSVTCHPAEVTFLPLPQPKLVLDLAIPEGCKAELT